MSQKVWLITGCSSGFGRALAEAVLASGGLVVVTARNAGAIADFAIRWPASAHVAELDVTDSVMIKAVVEEALRVFGRIDVLVNNAGVGLLGSLEETLPEEIAGNFNVNVFGPLTLIRNILPHFRSAKSGHVVNISAAAAIANYAGFGIYGAAKCALEGISESLALEGRSFGLKVTIVQPGPFRTDFISRSMRRVNATISEYDSSVGKFSAFLSNVDGKQPGDAERAAQAIIQAVEAERAPLRLVLGKYAFEKQARALKQREAELRNWESNSLAADGGTP